MRKLVAKEKTTVFDLLSKAGYSRTKIKQLLKYQAISSGKAVLKRADHPLRPGDELCLKAVGEKQEAARPCPGLTMVYEDDEIVVINKPAGLLSVASATEKRQTAYFLLGACLKARSGSSTARPFVVHRLDRDVSGLLLFAKSEEVRRVIMARWPEADRKYLALVEGVPKAENGIIASRLRESKALRVYSVPEGMEDDAARPARTAYEVVKSGHGYALLEVVPITGLKHQIRVHLADLGHPVAGDKKYGAKSNPVGRLALHASFLAFSHPVSGERLEFKAPVPGKFNLAFGRDAANQDDNAKDKGRR